MLVSAGNRLQQLGVSGARVPPYDGHLSATTAASAGSMPMAVGLGTMPTHWLLQLSCQGGWFNAGGGGGGGRRRIVACGGWTRRGVIRPPGDCGCAKQISSITPQRSRPPPESSLPHHHRAVLLLLPGTRSTGTNLAFNRKSLSECPVCVSITADWPGQVGLSVSYYSVIATEYAEARRRSGQSAARR